MTDPKPTLTPEIIADDNRLHALIDAMITKDKRYWRHTRAILRLQLRHQELASEDSFVAYLTLEEAVNERTAWMLAEVARWAFQEGRDRCDDDR